VFTQAWLELDLRPHPEGGWFRETYRSAHTFTPQGYDGPRAIRAPLHLGEPISAAAHAGRSAERGEVRPRPQLHSLAPAAVWSREETPRSGRPRSGEDGGSEGTSSAERSEAQKRSFDFADFEMV
jgi:hypothetical protein